jgi:glucose-6-phosphate 1-dehydrogenase
VITRLVLFGASGDLAGRYVLPALGLLHARGLLPAGFEIVGAATRDWDDEGFRRFASEHLEGDASSVLSALRYRRADATDEASVSEVLHELGAEAIVVYLALPPGVFPAAVTSLAAAGLPDGSRLALEKPFGEDLRSARELNGLIQRAFGAAGEQTVFRVDHVLGMATVQDLVALRLGSRIPTALWNSEQIEEVQILWEETLALEGRAGFYDRAGAVRDVMQNHMLQILALVAMEPPEAPAERDLRDRKLDALRSVRALEREEVLRRTRRARYSAGRLSGSGGAEDRAVPAYVDEDGVDPHRCTETFAEVLLELDTPRWAGTRFRLRAGKALARRRKAVVARFRPPGRNQLRIGLDGPDDIALELTGAAPGPLTLTSPPARADLPAYGRVLLEILSGGSALSVRGDEAEEAWRIVTPILESWGRGRIPMDEYAAGSDGPRPLEG